MQTREQSFENEHGYGPQPPAGDHPGANLARLRQAGRNFLSAGRTATDHALSRDSEAFIRANQQAPGQ